MDRRQEYINNSNNQSALRSYVHKRHVTQSSGKITKKLLGKTNCYIIGIGGGGNNTINRLMTTSLKDALCFALNTDQQHLNAIKCDKAILIGEKTTRGLGCGGNPTLGHQAAIESKTKIQRLLNDADIVFLTLGLGGGTGTGAVPVVAEIAKKSGAIVISVVTIPFTIEGSRKSIAYKGLEKLREYSDTVVVIENDRLLEIVPNLPIEEAFSVADDVLANYIHSIINTVTQPGLINVDFADLKTIITKGGVTICGIGEAEGENKAEKAVKRALENPLISVDYSTGNAALIHVTGGSTMSLNEASKVVEIIRKRLHSQADVIWGTKVDHELGELLRITVVISGVRSDQITNQRKHPYHPSKRDPSYSSSFSRHSFDPVKPANHQFAREEKRKVPTLRELREKMKKEKQKKQSTSSPKKTDPSEKFWEELGVSEGLK
ncbi:MAG: cell division protein FtsZ [Asgard group archaeon]|nr:cell division protein FtsZ [Asgard group archaeon]